MYKVKDWSTHIVKHFWLCSNVCRKDGATNDTEDLKVMKGYAFFHLPGLQFTFLTGHMYHYHKYYQYCDMLLSLK